MKPKRSSLERPYKMATCTLMMASWQKVRENMRYNKRNFKSFLKENLTPERYKGMNFEAYCEDLESQYCATGSREYELRSFESKDRNPHLFRY